MLYEEPSENEWVQPIRKNYRLKCCDCGLVHNIDFRIIKTKTGNFIQFRARRNERATWAGRRNFLGIKFRKSHYYQDSFILERDKRKGRFIPIKYKINKKKL